MPPLSSLQRYGELGYLCPSGRGDIEQARMLFAAEEARRVGVLSGLAVTGNITCFRCFPANSGVGYWSRGW